MRPLWNGTLTFGLVVIPVRLYAATERGSVAFHLLHETCHTPVKYMKWCQSCQREVQPEEIVKAFEHRKGEYVVVSDDEMEAIPGPDAHAIEILDFVKLSEVDPVYYEKSFFLEPREGAEKAYALLLASMKEEGKVALARVAIRAKETLAIVRTHRDRFILLETMFWADEVRAGEELRVPDQVSLGDREKAMARTLIETLTADFAPEKYRSRQREAVAELIQKKVQGQELVKQPQATAQVIDLMEALRRSVEKARTKKPESAKTMAISATPGSPARPETPAAEAGSRRRKKAAGEDELEAGPPPPAGR
jgi:DNA end-binding protein Ku